MSKQGYLKKKSSVAILGRHTWNKRFLVILPHSNEVAVYDSHETVTKQLDSLPFDQITSVQILPKKKRRRFNVTMQGSEVVALLAETPEEAAEWVAAISDAHEAFRAEAAAAKRKASEERRAAEAKEREDEANEVVVVVDVDGDDEASQAAEAEGPALAGHLVRMNSAAAVRSVSAVSFMSQASAVSEETFQSMRRMYFVLRNGTLTFYTNDSREVPLGFVEAANIEAVKAYKVAEADAAAGDESAEEDAAAEANKADGVRVYLGEEHELWELAVPASESVDAAAWVEALGAARDAAQADRASDAKAAGASGDGEAAAEQGQDEEAAAAAGGAKAGATTEEYQDVDLEAEKKNKTDEAKPKEQENDIKEKKKGGGCHCIVM